MLLVILRMPIKNTHHYTNQENEFWEIVISEKNQNEILETFISINIDAECNENVPAISFGRVHEDFCISTKISSNVVSIV